MGSEVRRRLRVVTGAVIVLTTGCSEQMLDAHDVTLAVPKSCIDPTDYGAIPDNNSDDRAALQAAIDAAKIANMQVCIPSGVFDIKIPGPHGPFWSLDFDNADDLTFAGTGAETVLKFEPTSELGRNWWLMWIHGGTERLTMRDFVIDGNNSHFANDDQTHAIQIGSASTEAANTTDITIHNVEIRDCRSDAIRIAGSESATSFTERIDISHSRFYDSHRSAIGIQRSVRNVHITDNVFALTDNGDLDLEASAPTTAAAQHDIIFSRNIVIRDSQCRAIQINGTSSAVVEPTPARNIIVSENVVLGGSIWLFLAEQVLVQRNLIVGPPISGCGGVAAPLLLEGTVRDVTIADNVAITSTTPGVTPVLEVRPHQSNPSSPYRAPSRISVQGGVFIQQTSQNIVDVAAVDDFRMNGAALFSSGTDVSKHAVLIASGETTITGLTISANSVAHAASLAAVVRLGNDSSDLTGVIVYSNRAQGVTNGVALGSSTGAFLSPPLVASNAWQASATDVAPAGNRYAIAGNVDPVASGGRAWLSGTTNPANPCTTGALYTQVNSGALFVCQASAWATLP